MDIISLLELIAYLFSHGVLNSLFLTIVSVVNFKQYLCNDIDNDIGFYIMNSSRDKIIEIAFLLSLKNGFDRVSIKKIQEESGLAAGSIYYHFKDKNEILECMVNEYIIDNYHEFKEVIRNLDGSFMEKIKFISIYKVTSFNKKQIQSNSKTMPQFNYKDYFILLMSIYHQYDEVRHIFHEMYLDLHDFYHELIKEAIENKEIRDDVDIDTLIIIIQTFLKGYLILWLNCPDLPLEKIVDANIQMIWESIKR